MPIKYLYFFHNSKKKKKKVFLKSNKIDKKLHKKSNFIYIFYKNQIIL